ncbi:MAG: extracellular solute-binding protein [Dactylosporangium sp.]|nr:extracellular solute-binding protein [Dactylosporangium sp.]NNJ59483.1 extracellular solute-binding protein [Dactylosporangium sp.]
MTISPRPSRESAFSRRSFLSLAGASAGAVLLGACGDDDGSSSDTVDFWNIGTADPLKTIWPQMAKDFEDETGTKVKLTSMENEAFKAKLTTVTQSGEAPHIFHSWGGGVLKEQLDAGLLLDLSDEAWLSTFTTTSLSPYEIDGKTYGIPFDLGMVTFWYNKELFSQAGITAPPTTWTEFLGTVDKLKTAGVTPIALAGQDKWPAHFYWSYLAMRLGGSALFSSALKDKDFNKSEFVRAGELMKELVALEPFQKGFLGAKYDTPDGQAAAVGNGDAAMELMGQWAPSTQGSTAADKKGLGDKLGLFPFPTVAGGKGKTTDAFGGGNGHAVGVDAPRAAVDFLKFISKIDNQRTLAASGAVLPVVTGAEDAIEDPNQAKLAEYLASATDFQLYLDQAFPPAIGTQVNDSVAELVAGTATPEQVTEAITATAGR